MGKGRKPTPTRLKILRGNPGKRPLPEGEPQPRPGVPTCPSHLNAAAKREWRRLVKELGACGLITGADRGALAAYCDAYARWVKATLEVATDGEVVEATTGTAMQNPWQSVANKALEQMDKFGSQFGLTPSARTRINTGRPPEDALEVFLTKKHG